MSPSLWDLLVEIGRSVVRVTEALYTWAERPEVRKGLIAVCEWATVDSRLQGYRERWAQDGVPISLEEAEYVLHCLGYAAFNEQVEPIQYLMSTLVKTPARMWSQGSSNALNPRHPIGTRSWHTKNHAAVISLRCFPSGRRMEQSVRMEEADRDGGYLETTF